jgi:hypothetical protein
MMSPEFMPQIASFATAIKRRERLPVVKLDA